MKPPVSSSPRKSHDLETAVLVHVGIFFVGATWAFGGNDPIVRQFLAVWGSFGLVLTVAGMRSVKSRSPVNWRRLGWLAPLVVFNLLVLVSCLTPNLRELHLDTGDYYAMNKVPLWTPGAAIPAHSLQALWLFDGIYLSCFNLAWIVRRRNALRGLLLVICANALALAIFGTLQKLVGSTGPFFGLATVQQPYFFASFVYHNHWGAFTILMTTACLGLTWHFVLRREGRRDLLHSPVLGALVAILFLATTVPLSGSRSCTVLQAGLLGGAFLHGTARFIRQRRQYKESVALPLVGALAAVSICIAGILYIAQDMIAARIAKTEWEFSNQAVRSGAVGRPVLYRDTWHMARDRLWFGWGMASYPEVFEFYNSQDIGPIDHLPVRYVDAHNDWLQSLAEHGLVGTAALGLCALVPLWTLKRHPPRSQLPKYPLVGCGIVLFYALVEFPFGNTAVVLTWWLLFFAAVRYAELQHASSSTPAPA